MFPTHDNLIAPIYRRAGLFDNTGVDEHLRQLKQIGVEQTVDGGLINLHGAFLELINPDLDAGRIPVRTDAEMWTPAAREAIAHKLVAAQNFIKPISKASAVFQEIATTFLPDTPSETPLSLGNEVWLAAECLIWRAFEALKAMNALQNGGVLEGKVCLGIAQESLIVLDWLLLNPSKLRELRINDVYGKWNMLRRIIKAMSIDGSDSSDMIPDFASLSSQLLNLGFDVNKVSDLKSLRQIAGAIKWHKMIRPDNPMLNKEALAVRYEIVFSERDSVAHSVPSVWPAYAVMDGDSLKVLASTNDPSPEPTSMTLWVWSDFFRLLRRLRPNLLASYDLWATTLYLGGGYGSTDVKPPQRDVGL